MKDLEQTIENAKRMEFKEIYGIMKTPNGPVRVEIPRGTDIQGECHRVEEVKQIQEK
jgi:hypothetical protein